MGKLFDIDGPLFRGLSLISDLVMLNLITLLFCLPIITAGASLTSMHAMVMKFHMGETGHIFRKFWKEFKGNFKKSTIIWIFVLILLVLVFLDLEILKNTGEVIPQQVKIPLYAIAFFVFIVYLNLMPYMAKFENTIRASIKNALLMTIGAFPRSVPTSICPFSGGSIPTPSASTRNWRRRQMRTRRRLRKRTRLWRSERRHVSRWN